MLDPSIFHPRDLTCKAPFGAVPLGTAVTLSPAIPADAVGCTLLLYEEFADRRRALPMETREGRFVLTFSAPETPELCWYRFRFLFSNGTAREYGTEGLAEPGTEAPAFQLTVYDGSTHTPAWFGEGVTYQIFPDRFCRLEKPEAAGMIGDRIVHEQWNEPMAYRPEDGVITNRDFFGGSLKGILSRLDYLESLSVSTIYLNPIFEAASNHRYDTCDYETIDPMLGTERDFRLLCSEAKKRGIRVILDGVFNHTGSGSRYFNALRYYEGPGAAESQSSPYYSWYDFQHWPDKYSAWWGIKTLPQVNESEPSYEDFIIGNENSVVRRWLRAGASGWRLDVADELPDSFIAHLRTAATEEKPDALILGEVWEDGSNKIAYDRRRKYLLGHETHGLMNYPFRTAALAWLRGGDAKDFMEAMETLREHYPPAAYYSALNLLGTHDTPRILTLCGQSQDLACRDRSFRAHYRLSHAERQKALRRLKLASTLQFCFPGSPGIYYGDEAGMEGCEDPFNRGPFPWGSEDQSLLHHYRTLGRLRKTRPSLQRGTIDYLEAKGGLLAFRRSLEGETTYVLLNNGPAAAELTVPALGPLMADALTHQQFCTREGTLRLSVPAGNALVLTEV